jgi:excisionase family DNA binding protein
MPEEGPAQKPHASDNHKPLNCMAQEFSKSGAHKQMILEQRQPMDIQASTWLTVKEAARYLSVKPRTLAQWARQGTTKDYVLSGTDLLSLQLITRTETWRINSGHRSSKDSLAASISP